MVFEKFDKVVIASAWFIHFFYIPSHPLSAAWVCFQRFQDHVEGL